MNARKALWLLALLGCLPLPSADAAGLGGTGAGVGPRRPCVSRLAHRSANKARYASSAKPAVPTPAEPLAYEAVRQQDSVWLISTRHLSCSATGDQLPDDFQVFEFDHATGWRSSDMASFREDKRSYAVTTVFVHGNRWSWHDAFELGLAAYSTVVGESASPAAVRFVIWSWPSAPIRGPVRDVRIKAVRSDYECLHLARFLALFGDDRKIGLVGFSYGSRIITGALHLRAGGTLLGYQLPERASPATRNVRAVLWAAAMPNYWLSAGQAHDKCLSQVDRLLIQFNPCDRILRLYRKVDRNEPAAALGYMGWTGRSASDEDESRVHQQNVSGSIGRRHDSRLYFSSAVVLGETRRYVLWDE